MSDLHSKCLVCFRDIKKGENFYCCRHCKGYYHGCCEEHGSCPDDTNWLCHNCSGKILTVPCVFCKRTSLMKDMVPLQDKNFCHQNCLLFYQKKTEFIPPFMKVDLQSYNQQQVSGMICDVCNRQEEGGFTIKCEHRDHSLCPSFVHPSCVTEETYFKIELWEDNQYHIACLNPQHEVLYGTDITFLTQEMSRTIDSIKESMGMEGDCAICCDKCCQEKKKGMKKCCCCRTRQNSKETMSTLPCSSLSSDVQSCCLSTSESTNKPNSSTEQGNASCSSDCTCSCNTAMTLQQMVSNLKETISQVDPTDRKSVV